MMSIVIYFQNIPASHEKYIVNKRRYSVILTLELIFLYLSSQMGKVLDDSYIATSQKSNLTVAYVEFSDKLHLVQDLFIFRSYYFRDSLYNTTSFNQDCASPPSIAPISFV